MKLVKNVQYVKNNTLSLSQTEKQAMELLRKIKPYSKQAIECTKREYKALFDMAGKLGMVISDPVFISPNKCRTWKLDKRAKRGKKATTATKRKRRVTPEYRAAAIANLIKARAAKAAKQQSGNIVDMKKAA